MEDVLIEAGKEERAVAPDRATLGKAELLLLTVRFEIVCRGRTIFGEVVPRRKLSLRRDGRDARPPFLRQGLRHF
jgi:hypothetical protein